MKEIWLERLVFRFALIIFIIFMTGCGGVEREYETAEKLKEEDMIGAAIKKYESVIKKFPRTEFAEKSLLSIGNLHFYKFADYDLAKVAYARLIEDFPDSSFSDEAKKQLETIDDINQLLKKAEILFGKKKYNEVRNISKQILELSPADWSAKSLLRRADEEITLIERERAFRTKNKKILEKIRDEMGDERYAWELLMHATGYDGGSKKTFKKMLEGLGGAKKEFFTFEKRTVGDYKITFAAQMQISGMPGIPLEGVYFVDPIRHEVTT